MNGLHRTTLTTSQKIECAASSLARQHEWGAKSALSREFAVSRSTVYAAADIAHEALSERLASRPESLVRVEVDEAQLMRAVVALRAMAPNSIRPIEDLLPVLYPGLKVSYGKIQGLLCQAEQRAAQANSQMRLEGIKAVALDEMYSQGSPVLAGVDLDSGALLGLELCDSRDAQTWARWLREGKSRGLDVSVVVKDAAGGIEAGVREVFPAAEQRDDCFHVYYEMNKVHRKLEAKAYAAIADEHARERALGKVRGHDKAKRNTLRGQLEWSRRQCRPAVAALDVFESAIAQVREALEPVDTTGHTLRTGAQAQQMCEAAADIMHSIDHGASRSVARYVRNRAKGLALAGAQLYRELDELARQWSLDAVVLGWRLWHLGHINKGRRRTLTRTGATLALAVFAQLRERLGEQAATLYAQVEQRMNRHHRASSAIEGFNAALRPFLYVHKGVTQGFLELFRFHTNHRIRRWGRHKGTSACEVLTGCPVGDWLTALGYPPSA